MSLLNDVIDVVKDATGSVGKKADQVIGISKVKMKTVRINSDLRAVYEKLGSAVYHMQKQKYVNEELIASMTEEIDELLYQLSEANEELGKLKNVRVCSCCGASNPGDSMYCAKCGNQIKKDFEDYSAETDSTVEIQDDKKEEDLQQ
ncbi:MAG TPA: zinc ribbon domain-containing protein [Firmicutes bacterium]|nr:zinc ribbon domain-containing protein [Bacillota bacterium]